MAAARFKIYKLILYGALLLLAAAALWVWREAERTQPGPPPAPPPVYPGFGLRVPEAHEILGIDVSRYQHHIHWPYVTAMEDQGRRLQFVFIKATEGTTWTDPHFTENWLQSRQHGMARGAYHFYNPDSDAVRQFMHFVNHVRLDSGDLPPVLDVETTGRASKKQIREGLRCWLEQAEAHYGIKPLIYTNVDFYMRYLAGHFDHYPLWVAHYGAPKPRIRRSWTFWQYSQEGRVNGIISYVDFNAFRGDSAGFAQLLYPGTASEGQAGP